MKIGIITSFYSKNYGAALQAFALQTFLEGKGHDVYIINYQNNRPKKYVLEYEQTKQETALEYLIRRYKNLTVKIFGNGLNEHEVFIRNQAFERFTSKFFHLTEYAASKEEVEMIDKRYGFEAYFCGSDQIWNPIVHAFDGIYFADFETRALKIAYAPSVAVNNLSESEISIIANKAMKMNAVSVREMDAAIMLRKSKESLNVEVVVDPTFLIDKNSWYTLFGKCNKENGKYILIYMLNYNAKSKKFYQFIEEYAKKRGCQIYWLPYCKLQTKNEKLYKAMYDVSPADFMTLLLNAECVFTNSFHATALSINNNINFYVFFNSEDGKTNIQSRLRCLIEEYGLEKRIINDDIDKIESYDEIDFYNINKKIKKRVNESCKFIDNSLTKRS